MFEGTIVSHSAFGNGTITKLEDGYMEISFPKGDKKFVFPDSIGTFIKTDDAELLAYAKEQKDRKDFEKAAQAAAQKAAAEEKQRQQQLERQSMKKKPDYTYTGDFETPLLGRRSLDIEFKTKEDFYEALGYLAKPGIIAYYQAEVPDDGKDALFEKLFPDQEFRVISVNSGSGGQATKQGCQFRINLSSIKNCPDSLKPHLGTAAGAWVGRINRSRFALKLVQKHGFRFGYSQNYNDIYSKVPEQYQKSFLKGYNR